MDLEKEEKSYEEKTKQGEIEKATALVRKNVGKDVTELLGKRGIDVNSAINSIISEKVEKEIESRKAFLQTPQEETSMTSELVYLMSEKKNDVFYSELQRRLDLLNLSAMQRASYIHSELEALDSRKVKPPKKERWTTKIYIMQGTKKEDLPKPEECTLSEMIAIYDDADAARVRDHHWLPNETMEAVWYALSGKNGGPYYSEFDSRTKSLDWKKSQVSSYVKNDCMLTARWKWHYNDDMAWQANTMFKD